MVSTRKWKQVMLDEVPLSRGIMMLCAVDTGERINAEILKLPK
jgi:hypothetical protein